MKITPMIYGNGVGFMTIRYDETAKDLPVDQLHHLFFSVGWSGSAKETDSHMLSNFNAPFVNSTLVISAWDGERLVGAIRVLSDTIIRSIIYDLVVDPDYQGKGIGKEMVKRCISHYPKSEWILETTDNNIPFYEKAGFTRHNSVHFRIPSVYQPE